MATPLVNLTAPMLLDQNPQAAELLRSNITGLRTLHKAATTPTAAPTNPYAVLDTTDAQAASCIITAIPNGANFATVFHDYVAGDSGVLTTAPIIRAWGEVPDHRTHNADAWAPPTQDCGPAAFAGSTTLGLPARHWIPLGELSTGSLAITVGTLNPAMIVTTGGWYRSSPAFIALLGCTRLLITVSTAAAGTSVTKSAINGTFNY